MMANLHVSPPVQAKTVFGFNRYFVLMSLMVKKISGTLLQSSTSPQSVLVAATLSEAVFNPRLSNNCTAAARGMKAYVVPVSMMLRLSAQTQREYWNGKSQLHLQDVISIVEEYEHSRREIGPSIDTRFYIPRM